MNDFHRFLSLCSVAHCSSRFMLKENPSCKYIYVWVWVPCMFNAQMTSYIIPPSLVFFHLKRSWSIYLYIWTNSEWNQQKWFQSHKTDSIIISCTAMWSLKKRRRKKKKQNKKYCFYVFKWEQKEKNRKSNGMVIGYWLPFTYFGKRWTHRHWSYTHQLIHTWLYLVYKMFEV